MTKQKARRRFGALTSILATLLAVAIGLTSLALQWESLVNAALGISVGSRRIGGGADAVYYPSSFGNIAALYKTDASDAEKSELAQAQTDLIAAERAFCIREQEEGTVLLKNGEVNGAPALPLAENERAVTFFGNSSGHFIYRTNAAGPSPVGSPQLITLRQAFQNAGFSFNDTLLTALENSGVTRVRQNNGGASIGEVPVSFYDSYKDSFSGCNDAAIVIFSRMAGEGIDLNPVDADGVSQLALHQEEADLLRMIRESGRFGKVIVLLNSANPMETGFLFDEQYGVDACLWIGEPSMYGMEGIVNVLTGKANPSGRLIDTYAANSLSAPAVQNFGNMGYENNRDYKYIVEAEGIYVGYKYYETRYADCLLGQGHADSAIGSTSGAPWNYAEEVVFPFGFGLGYTTFSQRLLSVDYDASTDCYTVRAEVENTGSFPGKSVVQVYAQTPYDMADGIEKPAIQLVGYNKTLGRTADGRQETVALNSREGGVLKPGEKETVTVEVPRYLLASYSTAAHGGKGGYVLTAGDYYLAIGENAHDALNNILAAKGVTGLTDENGTAVTGHADQAYLLGSWTYDEAAYEKSPYTGAVVENQLAAADINTWQDGAVTYLSRNDWEGTYPKPVTLTLSAEMKKEMDGGTYKADAETATPKGTYTQGADLGEDHLDFIDMRGVPYEDDETWNRFLDQLSLEDLVRVTTSNAATAVSTVNAAKIVVGDGPDGVGSTMQNGMQPTTYPSTVVAAAAFNPKTMRMRGDFIAEDALFSNYHMLWGPATNLHRTPFSGRNFEYYSEDSVMNYYCGYYEVGAMKDKGLVAAFKHFAGNNQETNRAGVATFNNEQAWREGSLRGFEGGIGRAGSLGVMTSFNLIGCTPSVSCEATNIRIMKDEWGFRGVNITDASTGQSYMNSVDSIMYGTNMYCLDNREADLKKSASRSKFDDILGSLRQANKQYYYAFLQSNAINGIASGVQVVEETPWWKPVVYGLDIAIGVLTLASLCAYIWFGYLRKKEGKAS